MGQAPPSRFPFLDVQTVPPWGSRGEELVTGSGRSVGVDQNPYQYQRTMDAAGRLAHCFVMEEKRTDLTERPLVSVVDDDESVRESLPDLLKEFGFSSQAFSSGQAFLSSDSVNETRCLILDIAMPGMSGLDVQQELKRRGQEIPIIFITGQKEESIRQQAFRQGAVNFLYKPFSDTALLEALKETMG